MLYACHVDGLPRRVVDAEFLHDAVRGYCEEYGLDSTFIQESGPTRSGARYWIERCELHEYEPTDIRV